MVKNKFIYSFSFALLFTIAICGACNMSYAQTTEEKPLDIKSAFFGSWKDTHNPNHLLEIYKEGAFIIVEKRSETNDGIRSKKYTVTSDKGNKIMVDMGSGATPLTVTDSGDKISFMGDEYVKK